MTDQKTAVQLDSEKLLGFRRLKLIGRDQAALGAAFNKAGGELPPPVPGPNRILGATFNKLGEAPPPK